MARRHLGIACLGLLLAGTQCDEGGSSGPGSDVSDSGKGTGGPADTAGTGESDPGTGSDPELCPAAPVIGCSDTEAPCAHAITTADACGQPTPSGADVDVYYDDTGWPMISSTLPSSDQGCEPYYVLVRESGLTPGAYGIGERIDYRPLGSGCTGAAEQGARLELLKVVRGDPCPPSMGYGSCDKCEWKGGDYAVGELSIYHQSDYPESPDYWFAYNGTGCPASVDISSRNTVTLETTTVQDYVLASGDTYFLGPDYDATGPNLAMHEPWLYNLDKVSFYPLCDVGECPSGLTCSAGFYGCAPQ